MHYKIHLVYLNDVYKLIDVADHLLHEWSALSSLYTFGHVCLLFPRAARDRVCIRLNIFVSCFHVQRVIEEGVLQLPKDRLRKFPELKFKYVEESSPEEFFIPYVWTLIYQSSGLYWTPESVGLFDPLGQDA